MSAPVGEIAQIVTERKLLVEGLVVLFVVIALPKGLSGISLPRLLSRNADADPSKSAVAEVRSNG